MAAEPARSSLFSSDTLEGLRAATAEAAHAVSAGDARAAAALHACQSVASAVAASDAGRTDEARRSLSEALAHTTDLRLLFLAYQFHFRLGELDRAEHFVRRRLDVAPPDSPDAARAWNNLGLILHFRAENQAAEAMLRRALDIDTRAGNDEGIARDLGNLALIPEARGDLDTAERLYHQSLAIAERIGAAPIIASKLANLGDIALARGRAHQARELWTRAAAVFLGIGDEKHARECQRKAQAPDAPAS